MQSSLDLSEITVLFVFLLFYSDIVMIQIMILCIVFKINYVTIELFNRLCNFEYQFLTIPMLVDTPAIRTLLEAFLTITVVVIIITTDIAGLPTGELHEAGVSLSAVSLGLPLSTLGAQVLALALLTRLPAVALHPRPVLVRDA